MMKKLRKKTGFSLGETMVALLIISLITMSIATAVAFGARQYGNSVSRSEARILCSSLSSIIQDELRNTTQVMIDGDDLYYRTTNYESGDDLSRFDQDEDGHIVVMTGTEKFLLLGEAAYSGEDDLTAELESISFDDGVFNVSLVVHTSNGGGEIRSDFTVIPLNTVKELDPETI